LERDEALELIERMRQGINLSHEDGCWRITAEWFVKWLYESGFQITLEVEEDEYRYCWDDYRSISGGGLDCNFVNWSTISCGD